MDFLCCYPKPKVPERIPLSISVVGDPGCGKTSLIYNFSRGRSPLANEMLSSANLDTDSLDIIHSNRQIKLTLFDTSGYEEDAKIRALACNQSDVIILCFPVNSKKALKTVQSDWAQEVKYLNPGTPFILVGTKTDMRQDDSMDKNTQTVEGKKTAKKIGAKKYFEYSAVGEDSVQTAKRIFGRAIREGLKFVWKL